MQYCAYIYSCDTDVIVNALQIFPNLKPESVMNMGAGYQ